VASIPGINSDSGVVEVGNAIFFGTGSSDTGTGDGVFAYTPLGVAPVAAPPSASVPEWPAGAAGAGAAVLVAGLVARHSRRR
jgi:hypothetical protein